MSERVSDEVRVRTAERRDVDSVVPLLTAQLTEHGVRVSAEHLATQVTGMLEHPDQGFVLVGEVAGAVRGVAYVSFARPLEHQGEVAWLEELYVAPEHRGAGTGARLIDEVLRRAEARGCVSVDLEVQEDHARVAGLYARKGFRSLKRAHWTRPLAAWDW